GGTITLMLTRLDSSIEVKVTDTGIGISREFIPFVFDRFRQADASSTRKYGGLGLGLAIVRHLVELHGGSVVAGRPGAGLGATFSVDLPVADTSRARSETQRPQPATMDLAGIRALVVDDEADTRELVAQIIEHQGGVAEKAESYDAALAALNQFTPNVLLI